MGMFSKSISERILTKVHKKLEICSGIVTRLSEAGLVPASDKRFVKQYLLLMAELCRSERRLFFMSKLCFKPETVRSHLLVKNILDSCKFCISKGSVKCVISETGKMEEDAEDEENENER